MPSFEPSDSDLDEMWEEVAEENGFEYNGPEWGVWRKVQAEGDARLSDAQRFVYENTVLPLWKQKYVARERQFFRSLMERD